MSINRRQFLRGVLATGVVVVGAGAATSPSASAAPLGRAGTSLGSAEAFLLSTGRRALG